MVTATKSPDVAKRAGALSAQEAAIHAGNRTLHATVTDLVLKGKKVNKDVMLWVQTEKSSRPIRGLHIDE